MILLEKVQLIAFVWSFTFANIAAFEKLNYADGFEVYLVLEEDGTEVDDEEYFQSLPDNTRLMLLLEQDFWSPVGPAYT